MGDGGGGVPSSSSRRRLSIQIHATAFLSLKESFSIPLGLSVRAFLIPLHTAASKHGRLSQRSSLQGLRGQAQWGCGPQGPGEPRHEAVLQAAAGWASLLLCSFSDLQQLAFVCIAFVVRVDVFGHRSPLRIGYHTWGLHGQEERAQRSFKYQKMESPSFIICLVGPVG